MVASPPGCMEAALKPSIDLGKLKSELEDAAEKALWVFEQIRTETSAELANAKINGIFLGAIAALRAAGDDVINGDAAEVARQVTNQYIQKLHDLKTTLTPEGLVR